MNLSEITSVPSEKTRKVIPNAPPENVRDGKQGVVSVLASQNSHVVSDTASLRKPAEVAFILVGERVSSQLKIESGFRRSSPDSNFNTSDTPTIKGTSEEQSSGTGKNDQFNIQELSSNVLNFVENALSELSKSGASNSQLAGKLEAAKEGVKLGFASAIKDLGSLVDDQLKLDIEKSKLVIDDGLDELSRKFLSSSSTPVPTEMISKSTSSQTTDFLVRTKDGDEISISFNTSDIRSETITRQANDDATTKFSYQGKTQNFQLTIEGNIDADEYEAINELIYKADKLASQFFYGDVQKAYENSVNLGFDNEQLAGFALQLRQNESSSKVRQYGEVKYANDAQEPGTSNSSAKSVAQYMNKMLDVIDSSKELLASEKEFKSIINGLINEMKDVQVPDLVSAINKFYTFASNLNLLSTNTEDQ